MADRLLIDEVTGGEIKDGEERKREEGLLNQERRRRRGGGSYVHGDKQNPSDNKRCTVLSF